MDSKIMVSAVVLLSCLAVVIGQSFDRPGECPFFPDDFGRTCAFDPNVHCIEDSQCGNGEKCCSHSCNKICKSALPDTYGECPLPTSIGGTCEFVPGVNCVDDSECGPYSQCCAEGCGKICKNVYNSGTKISLSISFVILTSLVANNLSE